MTGSEVLLRLESIAVDFPNETADAARAVHPLNLTIRRGEMVGLIGASGGGKSLTALATLGLVPRGGKLSGTISFEGQDPRRPDAEASRRIRGGRIALLPQEAESALNPVITIGAHLREAIRTHRGEATRSWRTLASELLASVELADPRILRSYPHQLSGGQKQRALLALALVGEPELLVADEPTSSLDMVTQQHVLNLIEERCSTRGMALLLISHDLAVVAGITGRILVLFDGRIVEEAPTSELLAHPLHPYSRLLVEIATGASAREHPLPVSEVSGRDDVCPCASFCPRVEEGCRTGIPDLLEIGARRSVRCPPAAREVVW